MLVLRRKAGDTVRIGEGIEVHILELSGGRVKIGFTAPQDVVILRGEVHVTALANQQAARSTGPAQLDRLLESLLPAEPAGSAAAGSVVEGRAARG